MILTELVRLYERLLKEVETDVPAFGFSTEQVSFCLVIAQDGTLIDVEDVRDHEGKTPRGIPQSVPAHDKRAVNIRPFFLCDNATYLLGLDAKGKPERTAKCHESSRKLHTELADSAPSVSPLRAIAAFFDRWKPEQAEGLPYFEEIRKGGNLVFRIDGQTGFVHGLEDVVQAWSDYVSAAVEDTTSGICLITGTKSPIARLHPPIKRIKDAQPTGASIVSFNLDSFRSYGKEQGYNAPVSEAAAFKYVAALNYLTSDYDHRVQIGDATTVFWSESMSQFDSIFGAIAGGAMDSATDEALRAQLLRLTRGKPLSNVPLESKFFVLGLAPNSSRVSIRFWQSNTIAEFANRLGAHLRDFALEKQYDGQRDFVSIRDVVREVAPKQLSEERKSQVNPRLAGDVTQSILMGTRYPRTLLSAMVTRFRADGDINYIRCSATKGYINRERRIAQQEEVPMSLNEDFDSRGYRLGRLFAALEKAQRDALGDINASIKDRYFGAASSTPARVFPILLRLTQHHVSKAEWGRATDRRIGEIMDGIEDFPAFLPLEEQGLFALGYYHQRNAFYAKRESTKEKDNG
jgi:CRISPR-associated protein Csd1